MPWKQRLLGLPWEQRSPHWKELDPEAILRVIPEFAGLKPFLFAIDAVVQHFATIASIRERGEQSVVAYFERADVSPQGRAIEIAAAVAQSIVRNKMLATDEMESFYKYHPMLQEYAVFLGKRLSSAFCGRVRGLLLGILWSEAMATGVHFHMYPLNMQIYSTGPSFGAVGPFQDDMVLVPVANYQQPGGAQPIQPYVPVIPQPPYPPPPPQAWPQYPPPPSQGWPQYPPPPSQAWPQYPPQQPTDTSTTTTTTVNQDGSISKIIEQISKSGTLEELVNSAQNMVQNAINQLPSNSGTQNTAPANQGNATVAPARRKQDKAAAPVVPTPIKQDKAAAPAVPTPRKQDKAAAPVAPTPRKQDKAVSQTPKKQLADSTRDAADKARQRADKKAQDELERTKQEAAAREAKLKKDNIEALKQAAQKSRDRAAKKDAAKSSEKPVKKEVTKPTSAPSTPRSTASSSGSSRKKKK
jgi:hypothetical protein